MSVIQLMRAEYTIEASEVPSEIIELCAYLEAHFLNLRGYIQTTRELTYNGVIEGPRQTVQKLFNLLETAAKFKALIQKLVYRELLINEYTQSKFSIMTKSDGKLWRSEFKINGQDLSSSFYEVYARKKATDLKLRGHMSSDSPEIFAGVIEGRREALEKLKRALVENVAYKKQIKKHLFTSPREIAHYTEDPFVVTPYEHQLFSCDFEVHGKGIPRELYEMFVEKKVQTAGARGSIQAKEGGIYEGRLEGERLAIESIQESLSNAEEFVREIEKCIFSELKPLEKYTTEQFARMKTGNVNRVYSCDFKIKGSNIPKDIFFILADAHTELWGVRGMMRLAASDTYNGFLEGSSKVIDRLQEIMRLMIKITPIDEVTFGQLHEIQNYSTSRFRIQN